MTLLAGATVPAASLLSDVAEASRRALDADGAALVQPRDGDALALGAAGLARSELDEILAASATPSAPPAVGGFATAIVAHDAVPGGPPVALWALRRHPGPVEHAALAGAFARHGAVALAADAADGGFGSRAGERAWEGMRARLMDELPYERLVEVVTEALAPAMGRVRVGIHAWDPQLELLRVVPGSFAAAPELPAGSADGAVGWDSCVARVFALGRPYLTNVVAGDPGVVQTYAAAADLRRLLAVPLTVGGIRMGVLELTDKDGDFTIAELRALEQVAPHVAFALALTIERRRAVSRRRVEEILSRVAVAIASGQSLQEFLGSALDELCREVSAAMVGLVPVSGEPTLFRQTDARPELERIVVAEAREASGVRSYVVPPRRADDDGWAAVHLPVVANGVRVATLAAARHRGDTFAVDDRRALSRLAQLVALAWVTERYQLERAALARSVERQRIGDELHDHTAQLLFAARLQLDRTLEDFGLPADAAASVERARSLIVRADESTRDVIRDLAERGHEGLEALLVAVVTAVEDEFAKPVQLDIAPAAAAAAGGLGRPAADMLAKVAREALVNAAKHAGPSQLALRVALTRRDRLLLSVADDGLGAVPRRREGHGIASLRRAVRRHGGVLRVRVARTGGTTVTVSLPL